jgi:hypothetical protein
VSPNLSSPTPAATLTVTYDRDVDSAAEVLLAVLRRSPGAGEHARRSAPTPEPAADPASSTPRSDDEDSAAA